MFLNWKIVLSSDTVCSHSWDRRVGPFFLDSSSFGVRSGSRTSFSAKQRGANTAILWQFRHFFATHFFSSQTLFNCSVRGSFGICKSHDSSCHVILPVERHGFAVVCRVCDGVHGCVCPVSVSVSVSVWSRQQERKSHMEPKTKSLHDSHLLGEHRKIADCDAKPCTILMYNTNHM